MIFSLPFLKVLILAALGLTALGALTLCALLLVDFKNRRIW